MRKLGILLAVLLFGIVIYAQQVDLEGILNRLELLEEYANMIYETVGTKVGYEELEGLISELDARISELEVAILNIQSTLETGLPAIRDMLYELSANIATVEEKSAMYTDVRVDSLKEELDRLAEEVSSLQTLLEDLRVTLDIHDGDILKIYETLGTLSEELTELRESAKTLLTLVEDVETMKLKLDMHDQDIVNIYDNLAMKADLEFVENLEASVTALKEAVNGLSGILTGLAAQIEVLQNRLELLEEYTNLIYDITNGKLSIDEFEIFKDEVEKALGDLRKTTAEKDQALDAKIKATKDEVEKALGDLRKTTAEKDQALDAKIKATNELAEQARTLAIVGILAGVLGIVLPFLIK